MCSKDSPSVKPDGTADAATLAAEYEEFSLDIEEQPLPSYRTDELRVRIEEIRATLAAEEVASAGQLQQLLRTVTEALADVRAARVVPAPEGRDLSEAVPGAPDTGAAYEVTETERDKATNVLVNLLFTVVETPTHEDRRRATEESGPRDDVAHDGDGLRVDDTRVDGGESAGDDESAGDAQEETDFGVTGYAGPE
ncbi:MAG: hypothetical protein J07HB67_01102 [halophilic archaeon J07HB67]|jgi:hypothetical protein|nr:MAG: hypothetical protein J07HB67_01102 [halophilic archaeon J07HB67]